MDAVDDTSQRLGTQVQAAEETPSLLVVVIDSHASGWADIKDLTFRDAVGSLLVLINAHLALSNANRVAVIGFNSRGARFFYPREHAAGKGGLSGTMYRQFQKMDQHVIAGLEALLNEPSVPGVCSASGPLSLALCYANRLAGEVPGLRSRALVVSVSDDVPSRHIATMNCIFAAQKLKMPIDVCNIRGDRPFLQQAADFTDGVYLDVKHPAGLIQYLMGAFTVEPALRSSVVLPTQHDVDFSAVCFTTKDIVDIGKVCSVCLAILKDDPLSGHCPVCDALLETSS